RRSPSMSAASPCPSPRRSRRPSIPPTRGSRAEAAQAMESYVFASVLLAAAMHAGWNAILKLNLEPLRAITLVSIAAGVPAVLLLPFVPIPHPDAWIYLFASLVIHLG